MDANTAIKKAGSVCALARILGVTRQAVQQYRRSGLPDARVDQLRLARPEWFVKMTKVVAQDKRRPRKAKRDEPKNEV